ncbi:MAG: caspase family protein [Hyphomonas sp.]
MAVWIRMVLAAGFALCAAGMAAAQTKRALIVGVGDYNQLTDLQKTHGDAEGYANVFRNKLAFDTVELLDPDRAKFSEAFGQFLEQIEPGDEVVFIFSGHGWSDGSENYLVMSDAPYEASEYRLKQETFALSTSILADIRARRPGLVLAIIDACRDNPFDGGTRSGFSRGLTRITSQRGSMVMFAADSGERALDRLSADDGSPYSVFTRTLLPKLEDPTMSLQEIAISVKSEVSGLARSVQHEQLPTYYDGLTDRQCLAGTCFPRGRSAGGITPETEEWLAISQVAIGASASSDSCESFRDFAERHPDSVFSGQARKVAGSAACQPDAGEAEETELMPPEDAWKMRFRDGFYRMSLITYGADHTPTESAPPGEPGFCWSAAAAKSTADFITSMAAAQGWTDCDISELSEFGTDARSTTFRFACTADGQRVAGPGAMTDGDEFFDIGMAVGDWIPVDAQTMRGTWRMTGYRDGDC